MNAAGYHNVDPSVQRIWQGRIAEYRRQRAAAAGEHRPVAASPSPIRDRRPGDVIVTPAARVTPSPRREERSPFRERQPVALASLFAERSMAMRRARGAAGPPPAPRPRVPLTSIASRLEARRDGAPMLSAAEACARRFPRRWGTR
jgi:hypothetical protein